MKETLPERIRNNLMEEDGAKEDLNVRKIRRDDPRTEPTLASQQEKREVPVPLERMIQKA